MHAPRFARSALLTLGLLGLAALTRGQSDPGAGAPVAADLPPGVQDVIRMTQAGVSESVILSEIKTSGQTYRLTPDQVITLTQDGVSQNVIQALVQTGDSGPPPSEPPPSDAQYSEEGGPPAPPPTPPADEPTDAEVAAPPPGEPAAAVSFTTFWNQLYPYGDWVQIPGYGWAWRPGVLSGDPDWRPYADAGHWEYTDLGWFWQSDYPWGDVVFHYGRWMLYPGYGWVWCPDYTWGPAWVCWRQDETDGVCGWAPLPPGARFVPGIGLWYRGQVCWDSDFGLGLGVFVFAPYRDIFEPDCRAHLVPRERCAEFYARGVVRNGYRLEGGHLVVGGLGAARIGVLVHRNIRPAPVREVWLHQVREHEQERAEAQRAVRPAPVPRNPGYRPEPGRYPQREERPNPGDRAYPGVHPVPVQPRPEPQHAAGYPNSNYNRPPESHARPAGPGARPPEGGRGRQEPARPAPQPEPPPPQAAPESGGRRPQDR